MKKRYIIGTIIAIIVVGGGFYFVNKKSSMKKNTTIKDNSTIATTSVSSNKVLFSTDEQENYYKLSQNIGDIGIPSASMTVNLNQSKTINGVNYYKTYSYDTRAAYGNDNSVVSNNNYSHLVNSKVISLNGQVLSNSEYGEVNSTNLSNSEIENQIYKIASLYVEGYTANNPNLKSNSNDYYEGNLNAEPNITINLKDTKNMNNETLYSVNININSNIVPIYVGLDGYIYISNENYYNELFFPNKAN